MFFNEYASKEVCYAAAADWEQNKKCTSRQFRVKQNCYDASIGSSDATHVAFVAFRSLISGTPDLAMLGSPLLLRLNRVSD